MSVIGMIMFFFTFLQRFVVFSVCRASENGGGPVKGILITSRACHRSQPERWTCEKFGWPGKSVSNPLEFTSRCNDCFAFTTAVFSECTSFRQHEAFSPRFLKFRSRIIADLSMLLRELNCRKGGYETSTRWRRSCVHTPHRNPYNWTALNRVVESLTIL